MSTTRRPSSPTPLSPQMQYEAECLRGTAAPSFFFGSPLPSPQQSRRESYADVPSLAGYPVPTLEEYLGQPLSAMDGLFQSRTASPVQQDESEAGSQSDDDVPLSMSARQTVQAPQQAEPTSHPISALRGGNPATKPAPVFPTTAADLNALVAQNAAFIQHQQRQLMAAAAAAAAAAGFDPALMAALAATHLAAAAAAGGSPVVTPPTPFFAAPPAAAAPATPPATPSPPQPTGPLSRNKRAKPLRKATSLTNLRTSAAAARTGTPADSAPSSPYLSSPYSPGLAAQAMWQETGATNPFIYAAPVLAPTPQRAARSSTSSNATTLASRSPVQADDAGDMDAQLVQAAKKLAQVGAGATDADAGRRQAIAEAALYTRSREAAAAITAQAYASLAGVGPRRRGSSSLATSPLSSAPSSPRVEDDEAPVAPWNRGGSSAVAAGTGGGVVRPSSLSRRGSGMVGRRKASGLDLRELGLQVERIASGEVRSAPPSRPQSPVAGVLSAEEEGASEESGEEGAPAPELKVEEKEAEPVVRVARRRGRRPARLIARAEPPAKAEEPAKVEEVHSAAPQTPAQPAPPPVDDKPADASAQDGVPAATLLTGPSLTAVGTAVPGKRTRLVCSTSIGMLLADGRFECQWPGCGKTFSTSGHLSRHARIHLGFKPFACDWPGCKARFSRSDNMRMHRKTHERPPEEVEDGGVEGRAEEEEGEEEMEGAAAAEEMQVVAAAYPSPAQTPKRRGRKTVPVDMNSASAAAIMMMVDAQAQAAAAAAAAAAVQAAAAAVGVVPPSQHAASGSLMAAMGMDPAVLELEMQLGLVPGLSGFGAHAPAPAPATPNPGAVDFDEFTTLEEGDAPEPMMLDPPSRTGGEFFFRPQAEDDDETRTGMRRRQQPESPWMGAMTPPIGAGEFFMRTDDAEVKSRGW
ncbi:hypothetical protein HDU96_007739 [Phlyctochytrium bullatum]|nr:hypothetical protein HDU96_007739 [Phlyctochytrium bullatum]